MILETAVGPVRGEAGVSDGMPSACVTVSACKRTCALQVCVCPAFWLGETTLQTAFCKEEQQRQGAGKACNRAGSALTPMVNCLIMKIFNACMCLSKLSSGQLPFLG
jgi:hypothetical protein